MKTVPECAPFGLVAVEQSVGSPAVQIGGEFPREVRGVLESEVEAGTAGGGMDVGGVVGEEHPVVAVPVGQARVPADEAAQQGRRALRVFDGRPVSRSSVFEC